MMKYGYQASSSFCNMFSLVGESLEGSKKNFD